MIKLLEKALILTVVFAGIGCTSTVYARTAINVNDQLSFGSVGSQTHLNMVAKNNSASRRKENTSISI